MAMKWSRLRSGKGDLAAPACRTSVVAQVWRHQNAFNPGSDYFTTGRRATRHEDDG
jgi:hypothetical protein